MRERPVTATVGHSRWWKIRRTKPGSPGDGAARFFIIHSLSYAPVARHFTIRECDRVQSAVREVASSGRRLSFATSSVRMDGDIGPRTHDPLRRCFRRRVPDEPRARNGLRRLAPGVAVTQAADPGKADDVGRQAGPLLDRTTAR